MLNSSVVSYHIVSYYFDMMCVNGLNKVAR